MPDYAMMNQYLYEGNDKKVFELTEKAIADGFPVKEVLGEGLIAGMSVVGEDFKKMRLYVPQVLVAARAMKAGMKIIKPLLAELGDTSDAGTLIMGTVKGDLHDIGKNLVCMMAEGAGFTVVDIGVDCSMEKYIEAVREHDADIVGMSALLTTTMVYMPRVITALKDADLGHVKTCIGGAPVSQMFADEIGADGYGADAASAVELFQTLLPAKAS